MGYLAALWSDGQVVTGLNHGDAFGKLTLEQKEQEMLSGFWNPTTGEFFVDDNSTFYVKNVVLVRHSQIAQTLSDPCLSHAGEELAESTAARLSTGIKDFKGFHSPALRCKQTAQIFSKRMLFEFSSDEALGDFSLDENPDDFVLRLKTFIEKLPANSIVITHSHCIVQLTQLLTGQANLHCAAPRWDGRVPECSVTFVNSRQLDFIGTVIA